MHSHSCCLDRHFCRFLVDCCLPLPLPSPIVANTVGADVATNPSATVFAAAMAAAVATALTTFCRYCCCFMADCCMPQPLPQFLLLFLPAPFCLKPEVQQDKKRKRHADSDRRRSDCTEKEKMVL